MQTSKNEYDVELLNEPKSSKDKSTKMNKQKFTKLIMNWDK